MTCRACTVVVAVVVRVAIVTSNAAAVAAAPAERASTRPAIEFPRGADDVVVKLVRCDDVFLVPVAVDGQDAGLFVVDTAATHVMAAPAVVEKLQLPVISAPTSGSFVGGRKDLTLHAASSVAVGGVAVRNAVIARTDFGEIQKSLGPDVVGVIGGDFLRRMPFTLDLPAATLTLHHPGRFQPPRNTARHALRVRNRMPAVDVTIEGTITAPFTIDTGLDVPLVMHLTFARLNPDLLIARPFRRKLIYGAGGVVDRRSTTLSEISVLGARFRNVEGDYPSESAVEAPALYAGFLGTRLLYRSRLTLDYAGGGAWLSADPAALPAEWSDKEFDPKTADPAGITPLMRAAQLGAVAAIQRFIERDADPTVATNGGETALFFAARFDQLPAGEALLAGGGKLDAATADGASVLHAASATASAKFVERMLAAGAKLDVTDAFGRTPLVVAAESGNLAAIEVLIDAGADVNVVSRSSGAALHSAAMTRRADIARRLLDAGADVNLKTTGDGRSLTPLAWAVGAGSIELAELLLERGADVNARDDHGRTPIFVAVAENDDAMIRLLISAGADTSLRGKDDMTAQQYAAVAAKPAALEALASVAPAQQATTAPSTYPTGKKRGEEPIR